MPNQNPQIKTSFQESHPHRGGSRLHQVQTLQLDQKCLQVMWHSASPGKLPAETLPHFHWPGQSDFWGTFFLLSGFLWFSYASVAKEATGQAEPKKDDTAVMAQKADKLETLLGDPR